jgi:hypothetical protein
VPELRAQLAQLAGISGYPQVLLRLGYADPAPPTPRISLRDRLIHHKSSH